MRRIGVPFIAAAATLASPAPGSAVGGTATTGSELVAAGWAGSPKQFRVIDSRRVNQVYIQTDGMLSSSFARADGSFGSYEAPVQLLYPTDGAQCSGVGVEDLANAAFFNFGLRDDYWNLRFARIMLTDRFLMAQRVFYAAATWDKKAVDQMARGRIERREDGVRIVDDVAAFLRDPGSVQFDAAPAGFVRPSCRASTVVGYGFSDSASLLRNYFVEGNTKGVFDAALIHTAGATCWNFSVGQAFDSCPRLAEELNAKVISLDAESDVQIQGGAQARQELADYRHYEIAGAAHLPKEEFDLMEVARQAEDENPAFAAALRSTSQFQNPEAMGPPTRAAFHHLVAWATKGTRPPDNAYIAGSFDAFGNFVVSRDRDGNALGGIRLPWLNTMLENGSQVGAALGVHDGVDPLGSFVLGGRYECFEDIRARYPSSRRYRKRVASGANYAAAKRWILEEDRLAYVRRAARLDLDAVPCPPWPDGR